MSSMILFDFLPISVTHVVRPVGGSHCCQPFYARVWPYHELSDVCINRRCCRGNQFSVNAEIKA